MDDQDLDNIDSSEDDAQTGMFNTIYSYSIPEINFDAIPIFHREYFDLCNVY